MLNQVILVGRVTKEIELIQEEGTNKAKAVLAVPRSYKNTKGEYDTDFIKVSTSGNIAEKFKEYCKQGDLVGIRGRVQGNDEGMEIVAEKLTFLTSRKVEDEEA